MEVFERHADPLDEATALAASLTDSAIAEARKANAPETHPDFDGKHCIDCDDEIHADRLALGKIRCVGCQSILEHKGKLRARPNWANPVWDKVETEDASEIASTTKP